MIAARRSFSHAMLVALLLLSSILVFPPGAADAGSGSYGSGSPQPSPTIRKGEDFTHSVLLELFVTTWCEYCPDAEDAAVEYSREYGDNFVFVTLVDDADSGGNEKADERSQDYLVNSHPTAIFDGGYRDERSGDTNYEDEIESCGAREVPEVEFSVEASDNGDGTMDVSYTAQYKGTNPPVFRCHIRAYIAEIVSRYPNNRDEPIPYGFIDYAFDEDLNLPSQTPMQDSMTWDMEANEANFTNLVVVAGIFDKRSGVEQYVVQSATTEEASIWISDVRWDPDYPENTDDMTFRAEVGGSVDEVELEYAICTSGSCGAPEYVAMEIEKNETYVVTVGDFGSDAESIHFRVIARDSSGEEVKSPLYELEFGAKPGGSGNEEDWVTNDPVFYSGVGIVILGFLVFGLPLMTRMKRDDPGDLPEEEAVDWDDARHETGEEEYA